MARKSNTPLPNAPSPADGGATMAANDSTTGATPATTPTPRRTSFSFLHRSKSSERMRASESVKANSNKNNDDNRASTDGRQGPAKPRRSFSGGGNRLVKRHIQRDVEEVLRQAKEEIPDVPPIIPTIAHQPQIQTFGGDSVQPSKPKPQTRGGGSSTSSSMLNNNQTRLRSGSIPHQHAKPSLDFDAATGLPNVPVPPVPMTPHSENVDPYARTESMTNRGRYSYASSFTSTVNGPRRVRRRKDPTPFNILVVGAANAGKTAFIDFLRTSCILPARKQRQSMMHRQNSLLDNDQPQQTSISPAFQSHYLETEFSDGERIGLTLWDSESLESNIVDLQLREITAFIESKFEETYSEENKLARSPGARDTHIHAVFLLLDPLRLDLSMAAAKKALLRSQAVANGKSGKPVRAGDNDSFLEASILDESLDVQVFRALQGKAAVVPVISKADTVTGAHMRVLKRAVWNSLKKHGLDPLENIGIELEDLTEEDDEDEDDDDDDDYSDAVSSISDESRPRVTHRLAGGSLQVRDSRNISISPARSNKSAQTEDSDIVDRAGPAGRMKKEVDADFQPPLPFSILTPDPADMHHDHSDKTAGKVGRAFAWGFADPYNSAHCDFPRLKECVLGDWRAELREKSRNVWYENWRTARLRGSSGGGKVPRQNNGTMPTATIAYTHPGPVPSGSRSNLRAVAGNVRAPLPSSLVVGGPITATAAAPSATSSRLRGASPALSSQPSRNASPALNTMAAATQYGAWTARSGTDSPASYRASHTPSSTAPRMGGFFWRSASAQRSASPANRVQQFTRSSGGDDLVTALPPVAADEVGVAR